MFDKLFHKLSKATYVQRAGDNLVATGEAWVALFMRYLENVRGHCRQDAQLQIVRGRIDLVQQLDSIRRGQHEILNSHYEALWGRDCLLEPGLWANRAFRLRRGGPR